MLFIGAVIGIIMIPKVGDGESPLVLDSSRHTVVRFESW